MYSFMCNKYYHDTVFLFPSILNSAKLLSNDHLNHVGHCVFLKHLIFHLLQTFCYLSRGSISTRIAQIPGHLTTSYNLSSKDCGSHLPWPSTPPLRHLQQLLSTVLLQFCLNLHNNCYSHHQGGNSHRDLQLLTLGV